MYLQRMCSQSLNLVFSDQLLLVPYDHVVYVLQPSKVSSIGHKNPHSKSGSKTSQLGELPALPSQPASCEQVLNLMWRVSRFS